MTSRTLVSRIAVGSALAVSVGAMGVPSGTLTVKSKGSGVFQVFAVRESSSVQLKTETLGAFNERISLEDGLHVVLLDCSSQSVIIRPGVHHEIDTAQLEFLAPVAPDSRDHFLVQCARSDPAKTRQQTVDRFSFTVIPGHIDILAGLRSLTLSAEDFAQAQGHLRIPLAAVTVAATIGHAQDGNAAYFVSSTDGLVGLTHQVSFGTRQYLLPGDYWVEVGGTRERISLRGGDVRSLAVGQLRVQAPTSVDLAAGQMVRGAPTLLEINDGHWIELNQTYSMLPGLAQLRLADARTPMAVEILAGQETVVPTRALQVALGCGDRDWACLGSTRIYLFSEGVDAPVQEGLSDAPIIFAGSGLSFSIEGSREIRFPIPNDGDHVKVKVGYARIAPRRILNVHHESDLLRIVPVSAGIVGQTFDLSLTDVSRVPLVEGEYEIEHYFSNPRSDSYRQKTSRRFAIKGGQEEDITLDVWSSERKLSQRGP